LASKWISSPTKFKTWLCVTCFHLCFLLIANQHIDVIFSKSNSNVTVICQIDNSCQMGNLLPRKNIVKKKMPEAERPRGAFCLLADEIRRFSIACISRRDSYNFAQQIFKFLLKLYFNRVFPQNL
jgi:hypothetical protein